MNRSEEEGLEKLGEILKKYRRRARLTQQQLSGFSTVSVRAIRDIELGKVQQPRRDTVDLLADAFGLKGPQRAAFELAAGGSAEVELGRPAHDLNQAAPPALFGPFVGRQPELRALTGLLGAERERLIVVVGTVGVGKTRLVLEAAQILHARDQLPVLWGYLGYGANPATAQARPTEWVSELIASGGRPDQLARAIGDQRALLVLDGMAAPPMPSACVQLLRACPQVSVVVTTREPGPGLSGRVLPLTPLPLVSTAAGGTKEPPALALMMSYLRHLRPDIPPSASVAGTMAAICRALDGLPLALESAASWLPLHTPQQLREVAEAHPLTFTENMLAADSDAAGRFRQALERSLQRLTPRHAALLRVLASTGAPWTVAAAAERVACTPTEALRGLHALLLRGLVRPVRAVDPGPGERTDFVALNLVRHVLTNGADRITPDIPVAEREHVPS